jgi:DNA-binding NarL/FixJ family response regulator
MGDKTRLVLIEDDDSLREEIVFVLETEGFEVIAAESGRQGLYLIEEKHPDIICCDIMLPSLDGYQVLKKLTASPQYADIPFIFITARSDWQQVRYGMTLGADDYITKPFSHNELLSAIRTRLNKRHLRASRTPSPSESRSNLNLDLLTPREKQVLTLIIGGFTSKEIALRLSISKRTVDKHRQNILTKLDIRSVAQLLSAAGQGAPGE